MTTEIDKAKQILKLLELRDNFTRAEKVLRMLCLQEMIEETKKQYPIINQS